MSRAQKGAIVCLLLSLHHLHHVTATAPAPAVNQATSRPLVLLHKLISGQPSLPMMDRRKAVTIGFNRWLRPLTFQVPDVISNLIPSSSNIIKVHDDPKNKTVAMPSAESRPNSFDLSQQQQQPMMGYDPLQLITNFDQNAFLKGLPSGNGPLGNFAYPNSSFAFDESQLSNVQAPLFSMQQQFSGGQAQFAMQQQNEKPYQAMPLYDHEENYQPHQQQHQHQHHSSSSHIANQENRAKPALYHEPFYSENEEESALAPRPQANQARFAMPNVQQQQSQQYGEHTSESHRGKDTYQSVRPLTNFNGDYYPKEPHHRIPHGGSGNYDYGRTTFNEPSHDNFFSNIADHASESSEKINLPYKKHSIGLAYGFANEYDKDSQESQGKSQLGATFYSGQQHKEVDFTSTERPYFQEYGSAPGSAFLNESKFTSEVHSSPTDFFQASRLVPSKSSDSSMAGQKSSEEEKSNAFDGQQDKPVDHSDSASYSSYFNTGFHSAASMLSPVMVKKEQTGELPGSGGTEDRSTVDSKLTAIAATNGVNVYPSPHHKTNLPRPVASRIKQFLKNMLTQPKY